MSNPYGALLQDNWGRAHTGTGKGLPMRHTPYLYPKLILYWATLKGVVIATVTTFILGTTFLQSVVIALVSGILGVVGMFGAAYIASHEARRNRDLLRDIKRNTSTAKREGDLQEEPEP